MQRRSVGALRQRFVEEGFETTLEGKPRRRRLRALAGEDEARLTALVCGPDPEGGACWTVRLWADVWVAFEHTDTKTVSRETIQRTLKKPNLNPGRTRNGASRMEDVLDGYSWERDESARWCAWMRVRSS
jgi:hypothetical protein